MRYIRVLTLIFILILISIVLLADEGSLPKPIAMIYEFRYGDKAGHFLLTGVLALLVSLSMPIREGASVKRNLLLGILSVMAIVTMEEFSQIFFSSRTFSLLDLSSSYIGICCFGAAGYWIRSKPDG
jgi:polysaccharide biosynthesis protein VpsQ